MTGPNFMTVNPIWTFCSKPQVSTCWISTRKWHHDSFSGDHEYLWTISCQSTGCWDISVCFKGTKKRKGKTNVFLQSNKLYAQRIFIQYFLPEKAYDKHIVIPDILAIFQHGQTDGALLIGVQLLIIQTHLQVLGYSLQRDFNYCSVAGSWVVVVFFVHLCFFSTASLSQSRQERYSRLADHEWRRFNYFVSLTKCYMI